MTKRKLLNQNVLFFLISLLGLFIFSCKNPLAQSQENQLSKETVKLKISTNLARTVLPTQFKAETSGLTWKLTGIKDGTSTDLGTWSDEDNTTAYSKMTSTEISVDVGIWDFTLDVTNSSGEKVLTGTTGSINVSTNSTLTFVMQEPTEGVVAPGQIEFTLNFPSGVVDKVEATLTEYGNAATPVDSGQVDLSTGEAGAYVKYIKTVDAGTYMLKLDLQQKDPVYTEQYKTINTYTCLIRVAPGLLSKGSDKLNSLAKLYKITYELDGGTMPESVTKTSYNQYTKFELPTPIRNGYTFLGWCTHATCPSESCEQLQPEGTTISISEDTTLYAKWQEQQTSPEPSVPTNGLSYFSKTVNGGGIDCLEISTTEGLNAYRDYINGTIDSLVVAYRGSSGQAMTFSENSGRIDAYLMANITVDNWIPIGKNGTSTYFEFEGNNFTITINSIDSSSEYVGVFGYVGNTAATNLKIKNLTVAGEISTEKQYAGGIVAYSNGATIENCVNKLQITGEGPNTIVGGIVGYSQKETVINNCVNFANLTSTFVVGGIVGTASFIQNTNYTLVLSKCINLGQIVGSAKYSYISGMVAKSNVSADISNCINIGQISGPSTSGATATSTGFIYLIKEDSVLPQLQISNCINTNSAPTGYVTNSIFVGNSNGTIVKNSNLYYDSTKWSSSNYLNDPDSIIKTGKTTEQLCTLNSENLFTDWSFAEEGAPSRYPLPKLSEVNETVWSDITRAAEVELSEIEVPEEIPGTEVRSLTELSEAIANTANEVIVIADDIEVTETLNITRDVTILANENFTLTHKMTSEYLFWIAPDTECVFTLGGGDGELIITGDANFTAITTNSSSNITININENVTFTELDYYAISVVNPKTTLNINGGKFDNNKYLPINVSESAIINFNSGSISNNSFSGGNNSASIYLKKGTLTIGEEAICINNTNGAYSGSLIWVGSSATATLIEEVLPTNKLYENNIGE